MQVADHFLQLLEMPVSDLSFLMIPLMLIPLYIKYGNTDCNDENNCDNDCEKCISFFCVEIALACNFVQVIDNVKSKCCY